jgi:hypothetical protein
MEVKWTKLSRAKQALYLELVDYFFREVDLHFRGVLIDKAQLNHAQFSQTHDDWYYKMCFTMLRIIDTEHSYRIYLDIKDTHSKEKVEKLEEILRNLCRDRAGEIIDRVQQIRSHESPLMQLTDLLIGAIGYHNRGLSENSAKLAIIRRIQEQSGKNLEATTGLREPKFNLLRWKGQGNNA